MCAWSVLLVCLTTGHGATVIPMGIAAFAAVNVPGLIFVAALSLTRLMTSLLFEVSPLDPVTYCAVSAVLACAAMLAAYVPARRATIIEPSAALRAE